MTNQDFKVKYHTEKNVRWYDNMADYANWLEDKLIEALRQPPVVRPASASGSEGEPLSAEGEEKQVKVTLHEYGYHCGDGCCFNYGTITTVNGVQMEAHNTDVQTILQQVLTHLAYSVEIETTYDKE